MENIDVIILSNTADINYYNLLKECVFSIKSSTNINTNIILIESNKKLANKDLKLPIDSFYIPHDDKFNYNKFLNYGLDFCKYDNLCISNNDVVYKNNTLEGLVTYLNVYDSVSPWDINSTFRFHQHRGIYEGYSTRSHVTGWCIVTNQKTIKKIGGRFDETFSFWFQDDDYSMLLEKNNLKHALIGEYEVYHRAGSSHELFDEVERYSQTHGLGEAFKEKWDNIKSE
jgi:hypothetical protein